MTQAERRAATRQRLLEAARGTFAEKGFHGASIEEISDRAGLSRGAFYANFDDKDALFMAILDEMVSELQHALDGLASADPSPDAAFAAIRDWNVGHSRVGKEWFLLYSEFRLHALREPRLRPKLKRHYRDLRKVLGELIDRQFAVWNIELPASPTDLASVLIAVDEGLALQQQADPSAIGTPLFLDMVRLLFEAVAAARQAP